MKVDTKEQFASRLALFFEWSADLNKVDEGVWKDGALAVWRVEWGEYTYTVHLRHERRDEGRWSWLVQIDGVGDDFGEAEEVQDGLNDELDALVMDRLIEEAWGSKDE